MSPPAQAADIGASDAPLPTVVIEATAIPGARIDIDKVPGNVQTLNATDISESGTANFTGALNSHLGSVSLNDNLDDPFQPDILYRGFEASPVLGTPQGLAVYQNGVRINEAFGDTVNWDLFPDFAIKKVEIVSSSPVYGLNALGGGISVSMKDGFSYQGAALGGYGGSFQQRGGTIEYGVNSDGFGFYLAGRALEQNSWRDFSSDSIRQVYSVFSIHRDRLTLDLSYTYAGNQLNGQGSAPLQELAVNRSLTFTGPQNNLNKLSFVTLNAAYKLSDNLSVQGVVYYRQYQQSVANGDTSDYEACADGGGLLCQSDGVTSVTNNAGVALPDVSQGGALPVGQNDYEIINAYGRGLSLQSNYDRALFGHGNSLTLGATLDYAQMDFFSGTQVGAISPQLLVEPTQQLVYTPENSEFDPTPVSLLATNRNTAVYLTDTFDLTSAASVTASARYNSARIDLRDQLGADLSGNSRFYHLNPAIGGTYKLLPDLTGYAGFSENTRTPTASEIECSDPTRPCLLPTNLAGDPPNLRQVIAHTYELGLRGALLERHLSWNLGLFRTQVDNDIYGIATSVSSGFFQNIGATRRQGVETAFNYRDTHWNAYLNYSRIDATFQSAVLLPSPSNPFQDVDGNINVSAGNRLPGIPRHRLKAGFSYQVMDTFNLGADLRFVSNSVYFGDESNQNPPLGGYHVVDLYGSVCLHPRVEVFGSINNLLNTRYSTFGIYSDPTGIGTPGVPAAGVSNGPYVDNRFQSPAAPFTIMGGIRLTY